LRPPISLETRARLSAAHKGKPHSPERRAKISAGLRGNQNHLGHKHSPEARAKMSEAHRGKPLSVAHRAKKAAAQTGAGNPAWRGGVSREPYGWEWSEELREEVRRRDDDKCRLCGAPQAECNRALDIHHVDYCKQNNDPVNLVALCRSCHMRTGANRGYWKRVFQPDN